MADPSVTVGGVTYKVTPEYLASAATDTTNTAARISDELAQIKAYVYSLEASWGGMAHDRFVALMAEYDVLAKMLNDALTGIAAGLQGNYVNYKESEQQNITNLGNIEAGMPGGPGAVANLT
ncbi:WXG100 family type VII secretion target [Actinomadura algeriensis]|uniref:WXG100 family type VII secretion target n=1 Tax=Actinomadura algeriensis TaxID=1679523 RepID=A0ABR9JTU3_9ACTN|nr:WXG100 family type VII secretion target [Actinomadura algeriensis]MBE1533987.1 WXG100 family type VII secretion target [Actinomadura algeriensis]